MAAWVVLCLLAAGGQLRVALAEPLRLTLILRDAASGAPTAARVQVQGPEGPLFEAPDPLFPTRSSGLTGPYVHAEDSLLVEVEPGPVRIRARRGLTGSPLEITTTLGSDTRLVLSLEDWVRPRLLGWVGGDAHVHLNHGDADYGLMPPSAAGLAARAEGLDLLHLLENDPEHPSGPLVPPLAGTVAFWGEEYRSDWWGHAVLLGLEDLVVSENGLAGCCGLGGTAWPLLSHTLATATPPLVLLAHPHPTDDLFLPIGWPGGGTPRELYALALGDAVDGLAVASGSNAPSVWALTEYLDAVRAGARWSAVGESDGTLDRWWLTPPGILRTYAWVDDAQTLAGDALEAAWREAVRRQRCYATSGPVILELRLGGFRLGETVYAMGHQPKDLRLHAVSRTPMRRLRLHGRAGIHGEIEWPQGRAEIDTTLTLGFETDDFVVVELQGDRDTPLGEDARAVSSPFLVVAGQPLEPVAEGARRAIDRLAYFWERTLIDRSFDTVEDSQRVAQALMTAMQIHEDMVDDPPAPFTLLYPAEGQVLPSIAALLRWTASRSYDGEATSYRVALSRAEDFSDAVWTGALEDSTWVTPSLEAGQRYFWQVEASEPGDPPRLQEGPPRSFWIDLDPVSSPVAGPVSLIRLDHVRWEDGVLILPLELGRAATLEAGIYDLRGRRLGVLSPGWLPAGPHRLRWDGRDGRGAPVARGVYWIRVEAGGEVHSRRLPLSPR